MLTIIIIVNVADMCLTCFIVAAWITPGSFQGTCDNLQHFGVQWRCGIAVHVDTATRIHMQLTGARIVFFKYSKYACVVYQ